MIKSLFKGLFSSISLFCISTVCLNLLKIEGVNYNMFLLFVTGITGLTVSLKDYLNKPILAIAETKDNWKTYDIKLTRR